MPPDSLQTVINAVPDAMVRIAPDGEMTHANSAATAMLGDWILGRSYDAVIRQPGLLARIETAQANGVPSEGSFERSDQSGVTQYQVRLTPMDAGGLLLHFTNVSHLQDAEEMRRDFVANVSHELRTPLTAVLGFIETLRGPARDDAPARERFLGIMEDEARRMNRLVSDLLSLSRVESEARVRPNEDVDLIVVLQGVLAALKPAAEDAGNTLDLTLDPNLGEEAALIRGDRDQVMQIFLNLCENALKYGGPDKPVAFHLSREEGKGLLKGPVLRVDVTDQGEGIDSVHLPRLTERFYRIDAHRSREMGGTGLGLAIVKHIVNRHRGRLRIASELGKGTTFSVQLPAI